MDGSIIEKFTVGDFDDLQVIYLSCQVWLFEVIIQFGGLFWKNSVLRDLLLTHTNRWKDKVILSQQDRPLEL